MTFDGSAELIDDGLLEIEPEAMLHIFFSLCTTEKIIHRVHQDMSQAVQRKVVSSAYLLKHTIEPYLSNEEKSKSGWQCDYFLFGRTEDGYMGSCEGISEKAAIILLQNMKYILFSDASSTADCF